jgi:hypothetical protein
LLAFFAHTHTHTHTHAYHTPQHLQDLFAALGGDNMTAGEIVGGTHAYADNEYNVFSPNCLRTAAQMAQYGFSPYSSANGATVEELTDEKCFNAAALALPSVALALALVLLAVISL